MSRRDLPPASFFTPGPAPPSVRRPPALVPGDTVASGYGRCTHPGVDGSSSEATRSAPKGRDDKAWGASPRAFGPDPNAPQPRRGDMIPHGDVAPSGLGGWSVVPSVPGLAPQA